MASRPPLANTSRFAISVAVDYYTPTSTSRPLRTSATPSSSIVLVVLLALLAFLAYLLALAIIVELEQAAAAALSPAAAVVLGWLGNLAINFDLAVAFRIFGFELYLIGIGNVMLAARN
jgi:hypothetical protein